MGNPNILKPLPKHWERFYPTLTDGTVARRVDGMRIVYDEETSERRPFRIVAADGSKPACSARCYSSLLGAVTVADRCPLSQKAS